MRRLDAVRVEVDRDQHDVREVGVAWRRIEDVVVPGIVEASGW
jgi:hypothetical protein